MNKKAAMEMSISTFILIALGVTMLVLGLVFVRTIFSTGTSAIDQIDTAIQDEINKLFADEDKKIVIYPSSRQIELKKGDDPKGFAFSVRNNDVESASFEYTVDASDISNCGSTMTETKADSFLLGGSGSFSLGPGNSLDLPRLVKFEIPETAPPCTMIYNLEVEKSGEAYSGAQIFVVVK